VILAFPILTFFALRVFARGEILKDYKRRSSRFPSRFSCRSSKILKDRSKNSTRKNLNGFSGTNICPILHCVMICSKRHQ